MQFESIPHDFRPAFPADVMRGPVSRADGAETGPPKTLFERIAEATGQSIKVVTENIARKAAQRADGSEARYDSGLTLIAQRDVEQVLTEVLRDDFGERYSERYIPIETAGVEPWSDRYIQKRVTRKGLLDYVTSADMPWIDVEVEEISRKLHTLGGKVGWSWFDLQRANRGGAPLESEKLMAAREAAAETQDMLLISGDSGLPKKGGAIATGFINDPAVPTTGVLTGNWIASAATADQVIADVTDWFSTYRANNGSRRYPRTKLLLPEAEYAYMETLRLGGTGKSVRSYLIESIPELDEIGVLPELDSAGAGNANRAVIYPMDPRIVRGVVPMPFMFLPAQEHDLMIVVHGVTRIAGTEIRRPFAMLYADGA